VETMPFYLPEGIENITLARQGQAEKLGIWDSSIKQALADIDLGIAEAKGRYHGAGDGAASTDNPVRSLREGDDKVHTSPFTSACWSPQLTRVDKLDVTKGYVPKMFNDEELVIVKLKCKGAIIDGVLRDLGGLPQSRLQLKATQLVPYLENLRAFVEGMDKNDEDGKHWHDNAVRNSLPPKQRKKIGKDGQSSEVSHCMKQDRWVSKGSVESKSSYPSKAY